MKSLRLLVVLAAFLILLPSLDCEAEYTVLVHARPLHVRHFSGKVVDTKGMTVEYATVELRDPKTHKLLASTFADGQGYFYFDDKKYGKRIELRVIQKGFDITQYTVMRRPFGELHIRLVVTAAS